MATTNSSARPNNRGLGRGLAALIPESDFDLLSDVARGSGTSAPITPAVPASETSEPESASSKKSEKKTRAAGEVRYLKLAQIEPNPFQPRQVWSEAELDDLAASLREHGVLQPILVRPLARRDGEDEGQARYQLIAGERRWRAAARAELALIPAIVREVDDRSALELAIIENVQRHDISAIESAQAYRRLASEFGLSQEKIAARVGKSRAAVANTMRLLDLPTEAIEALQKSEISEGHGRALLTASSNGARRALLRRVLRDGLSVREVERLAREGEAIENEATENEIAENQTNLPRAQTPDVARLEDTLQRSLGMKLRLRPRRRGGQLVIEYSSPEELQRLARRITAPEIQAREI